MRVPKLPVLALLSLALFAAIWLLQYARVVAREPAANALVSFVLAALYGWPALFGLARSVGAGPFGRSVTAASIALSPVLVTLALFACELYFPAVAWLSAATGIWVIAQVVVVPLAWAAARAWFAHHGSLPNNPSNLTH